MPLLQRHWAPHVQPSRGKHRGSSRMSFRPAASMNAGSKAAPHGGLGRRGPPCVGLAERVLAGPQSSSKEGLSILNGGEAAKPAGG